MTDTAQLPDLTKEKRRPEKVVRFRRKPYMVIGEDHRFLTTGISESAEGNILKELEIEKIKRKFEAYLFPLAEPKTIYDTEPSKLINEYDTLIMDMPMPHSEDIENSEIVLSDLQNRMVINNIGKNTRNISLSFFFLLFPLLILSLITGEVLMNTFLNSLFVLLSIGFYIMGVLIIKKNSKKSLK